MATPSIKDVSSAQGLKTRNISSATTSKKLEIKVPIVDINNRFEDILRMSMEQQAARLGAS